jgi:hypothetical protein
MRSRQFLLLNATQHLFVLECGIFLSVYVATVHFWSRTADMRWPEWMRVQDPRPPHTGFVLYFCEMGSRNVERAGQDCVAPRLRVTSSERHSCSKTRCFRAATIPRSSLVGFIEPALPSELPHALDISTTSSLDFIICINLIRGKDLE